MAVRTLVGKPVVGNTRITVDSVLEELGAEVLRADVAYPLSKSLA